MQITSLDSINVPDDRQRQHFTQDSINDLATSISTKGLLHPVVVARLDTGLILVAGERRLRALRILEQQRQTYSFNGTVIAPGQVPYTEVDLPFIERREAELEENLIREDLTWEEQCKALNELHELRLARGSSSTGKDTAEALKTESRSVTSLEKELSRSRLVAPHLEDPDVKRAKSLREAEKIVTRKIGDEFENLMSERQQERGQTKSPHTLIEGDLCSEMRKLPDAKFSCIIADPPYGMNAGDFGDAAKLAHHYADEPEIATELAFHIFEQGLRVTRRNACLFMFCDIDLFTVLKEEASELGWKPFRTPLVWSKGPSGHAPWNLRGFRRQYEILLYAIKGDPALRSLHSDIFEVPNLRDKTYAAQKPSELYEQFIRLACAPSEQVLDPCCGAGTIFSAARATGTLATGIELDPQACVQSRRAITGESLNVNDFVSGL